MRKFGYKTITNYKITLRKYIHKIQLTNKRINYKRGSNLYHT